MTGRRSAVRWTYTVEPLIEIDGTGSQKHETAAT
jgi:hypothetical protein